MTLPRHKKYEPAGKKASVRSSAIWLDQADARELKDGEEFTLMDWGNAVAQVGRVARVPRVGGWAGARMGVHPARLQAGCGRGCRWCGAAGGLGHGGGCGGRQAGAVAAAS